MLTPAKKVKSDKISRCANMRCLKYVRMQTFPKPEAYLPISTVNDGFREAQNKEHLSPQSASLDLI